MKRFIPLFLCLLGSPSAMAESPAESLTFEKKAVEVNVEPGADSTSITFPFQNNTGEPIEITKQASPCSCINASFKGDKKTYQPGEKGEVEATFKVSGFYGTVSKQVIIWQKGDSEAAPSIILTANITIPDLLSVTPRTLNWKTGEAATPLSYKIKVTHKEPIRITGVVVTNNNFSTQLKTITDGQEYELIVTPFDTSETSFGIIKITSDSSISRYRLTQAFAYVRQIQEGE